MKPRTTAMLRATAVMAVSGLLIPMALPSPAVAATPTSALSAQVLRDARSGILKMMFKTSAGDTHYMIQNRFTFGGEPCARCELGPAVAAAALWRRTGDDAMKHAAMAAMDRSIQMYRQADGSFGPADAPGRADDVQTAFFAEHLGMMLFILGPTLDVGHRRTYTSVLRHAVDALVTREADAFYSNGNINLALTVALGMTWRATNDASYKEKYDAALRFTLDPGPDWPGFGFKLTTGPGVRTLGRDSAGYLAEKGDDAPGYDTGYTQFQADLAAQGYLVTGDPLLLTLLNRLSNQLLRRVNTTNWSIDLANGTRTRTNVYRYGAFTTPALKIAALDGRPEIATLADAQTRFTADLFDASADTAWSGMYQSWGTQLATLILAVP